MMVHTLRDALLAALFMAAVSTFGDFVWATLHLPHRVAYGVIHGALFCLCIGGVIGARIRRWLPGTVAGPLVGVLAAGTFYALAPALRWRAMLPAWMLFWVCFAFLQGRLANQRRVAASVAGGLAAALLSGMAFYAISGIWTRPSPRGPDYVRNFLSWTFAFFPGFLALFVAHDAKAASPRAA